MQFFVTVKNVSLGFNITYALWKCFPWSGGDAPWELWGFAQSFPWLDRNKSSTTEISRNCLDSLPTKHLQNRCKKDFKKISRKRRESPFITSYGVLKSLWVDKVNINLQKLIWQTTEKSHCDWADNVTRMKCQDIFGDGWKLEASYVWNALWSNARARCDGDSEGRGSIPDKCFPPFQAHGWARVQPQTQCTMAPAPERDSQRWNRREKGHLELSKQRQALKKQLQSTGWQQDKVCWEAPGKVVSYFINRQWTSLNLLLMIIRATS